MNVTQLREQILRKTAELEGLEAEIKNELRADIENKLREANLTLEEVFPDVFDAHKRGRKRSETIAKFRHPDTGEEWSGRGRMPRWVQDVMLIENMTIDAFRNSIRYKILS
jgi:DNA-binding protein H-NS